MFTKNLIKEPARELAKSVFLNRRGKTLAATPISGCFDLPLITSI